MSADVTVLSQLGVSDVIELLSKSANARDSILVGGQATNFWAVHYGVRSKGVMLSADIDFIGAAQAATKAGMEWGGRVELPQFGNFTPNTAVVYVDINGETRGIDFLESVLGVDNDELNRMAVKVQVPENNEVYIRVMHPVHCMISQVVNAYDKKLNRRADPRNGDWIAERCKITVQALNLNIQEYLKGGGINAAKKIVRRIAVFAMKPPALEAYAQDGLNVLAAVPIKNTGWKENFIETFYEPLERKVEKKRNQYIKHRNKSE